MWKGRFMSSLFSQSLWMELLHHKFSLNWCHVKVLYGQIYRLWRIVKRLKGFELLYRIWQMPTKNHLLSHHHSTHHHSQCSSLFVRSQSSYGFCIYDLVDIYCSYIMIGLCNWGVHYWFQWIIKCIYVGWQLEQHQNGYERHNKQGGGLYTVPKTPLRIC